MKRVHVYFSGTVQGVGFRFSCRDIAERLGKITGMVENLSDGRVELVAEGEEKHLKEFLKEIQEHFANYINDTKVEWEETTKEFSGFEIE